MVNRREFFKKTVIGLAAATAAGCGVKSMQPRVHPNGSAIKYLTNAYNDFYRANKYTPKILIVGENLHQAFMSELQSLQRIVDSLNIGGHTTLKFKSVTLYKSPVLRDWDYAIC